MRRRSLIALLGGAAAWPLIGRAQQKQMPVIGYLGSGSRGPTAPFLAAFHQGLSENGYIDRQNVTIEFRWAEGRYDRLPSLVADLVHHPVDVIVAQSNVSALAAKRASSTIAIVFQAGTDPIAAGLVASLAKPGGNVTGVAFLNVELMAKRLELLAEMVPQAGVIALLVNQENSNTERSVGEAHEAARVKGIQLHVLKASTESGVEAAFATLVKLRTGGLLVGPDPYFTSKRNQLVALALRHAIPAIYTWRDFADVGGLMSYGTSLPAVYRQTGIYAGKILNGTRPADLPVVQPTKFELVINLTTAKALGLTVPQSLLARADEVIE